MKSLGESNRKLISRTSSQSADSHKFFNKRLSFKSDHIWKTCEELQEGCDLKFVFQYY